jgi:hypothetical protein
MSRLALLAFAVLAAATQAQAQTSVSPTTASCPECGVVRSIKRVESGEKAAQQAERAGPSGLVANIPFDGGKPKIGSSTELSREKQPVTVSYEVVVRHDDGRLRVVLQDDVGGIREGDKVKVEQGRVVPRAK